MAIDAQILANIGKSGPDIVGSIGKAYTLANTIDQAQLNKMTLESTREEQADLAKIKTLSQQYDLSNPDQRHELSAKVQKEVGGKYAMDFMRQLDEQDRRAQELSASALDIHSKKAEILVNATLPFMQQVAQATQAKVDPQIIETQMLGPAKQVLERLTQEKLPNGEPVLNKNDMQGVQAALSGPPGSLLKFITGAYQSNMKAQQQIAELQTKALQGERERGQIAGQNIEKITKKGPDGKPHLFFVNKVTGEERDMGIAESPERPQTINVNTPTADEARNVAQMVANYEIPAPSARSPGFAKMMTMVKELNPSYNAARYDATKAEAVKVAQREAATAAAVRGLTRPRGLFDQTLETAKKIDFGSNLWKNSLKLYAAGNVVSDPAIRDYFNALADTRAEFASVLARTGQVTDAVRSAAEHAFPDKMSYDELKVAVERSKKVAESIEAGNQDVLDRLLNGESLSTVAKAADKTPTSTVTKPPAESPPLGTPRDGGGGPKQSPAVGTIVKGHRYKGGDPSLETSWEKVGG